MCPHVTLGKRTIKLLQQIQECWEVGKKRLSPASQMCPTFTRFRWLCFALRLSMIQSSLSNVACTCFIKFMLQCAVFIMLEDILIYLA